MTPFSNCNQGRPTFHWGFQRRQTNFFVGGGDSRGFGARTVQITSKFGCACGGCGAVGKPWCFRYDDWLFAPPVRQAIFGVFHMVYRLVKRYGSFTQLAGDAETAALVGAQVAPTHRSPVAPLEIAHSIARPIRAAGAEQVLQSAFFALASDSSTDRAANRQELGYTRPVHAGRSHTALLCLLVRQVGSAVAIVAAYKHVMLRVHCVQTSGSAECFAAARTAQPLCSPPETGSAACCRSCRCRYWTTLY